MSRRFGLWSSFLGFTAVALGAFGAHALKDHLSTYSLSVFHTGVQYQFFHAIALLAVSALLVKKPEERYFIRAAYCLIGGTVVFSGSLYLLALTSHRWLGMITPLGGATYLVGWYLLWKGFWKEEV